MVYLELDVVGIIELNGKVTYSAVNSVNITRFLKTKFTRKEKEYLLYSKSSVHINTNLSTRDLFTL